MINQYLLKKSNYKTYIANRYGEISLDIPEEKKVNHEYNAYLID